jgi:hypothetical protein
MLVNRADNPGGRKDMESVRPVDFVPTLSFGHRFRFSNGSNTGNFMITRGNLLNLYLASVTATTAYRIISAIKLKRVQVWCNPPALGSAPMTVAVEWTGENAPSTIHSDSTMGVRAAYVSTRPPIDVSNRWWSISGGSEYDVLFTLILPADAIVDITTSIRTVDNEAAVISTDTPAGATPGTIYFDYLDGIVSGKLAPVGPTNVLP